MSRLYRNIILTGLIAGTLDILAAITNYYIITGKTPGGVFKFIGRQAFTGDPEYIPGMRFLVLFTYPIAVRTKKHYQ